MDALNRRLDEINESRQEMSKQINELHEKMNTLVTALLGSSSSKKGGDEKRRLVEETGASADFERTSRSMPVGASAPHSHAPPHQAIARVAKSSSPMPEPILYSSAPIIYKSPVPESKKSWDVKYADYKPTAYTSEQVVNDELADSDLLSMWVKFSSSHRYIYIYYSCNIQTYIYSPITIMLTSIIYLYLSLFEFFSLFFFNLNYLEISTIKLF